MFNRLFFGLSCVIVLRALPTPDGELSKLLIPVLNGVERCLDFFSSDYSDINVDGLYGLRIGEGQIRNAVEQCKWLSCSDVVRSKLDAIQSTLNITCTNAEPYVAAGSPRYYKRFKGAIDKPFIVPYHVNRFKDTNVGGKPSEDVKPQHVDDSYNEDQGDDCFSRILGTFKVYNGVGGTLPACNITRECWTLMSSDGGTGYTRTHQLLYFIAMDHMSCSHEYEKWTNGTSTDGIKTRLCEGIYKETKSLVKLKHLDSVDMDMFLEQSSLCGVIGFESFMRPDWMNLALQLQSSSGCFGKYKRKRRSPSRKLLRDQSMKDGCSSHTSGLGFATLSTYLRYILLETERRLFM